MNVALRTPMTVEQFLAWEDRQDRKHEFDGVRITAMTSGSGNHAIIQANLIAALVSRLRGSPCRAVGSELKLIMANSVRYPDAMIVCAAIDGTATAIDNPAVVFEIVSPSSGPADRITKNLEYSEVSSIQRYVILEQGEIGAAVFSRAGGDWSGRVQGKGSTLQIPEAGIETPLDEFYDSVTWPGVEAQSE